MSPMAPRASPPAITATMRMTTFPGVPMKLAPGAKRRYPLQWHATGGPRHSCDHSGVRGHHDLLRFADAGGMVGAASTATSSADLDQADRGRHDALQFNRVWQLDEEPGMPDRVRRVLVRGLRDGRPCSPCYSARLG